jgi:hypothetical protein
MDLPISSALDIDLSGTKIKAADAGEKPLYQIHGSTSFDQLGRRSVRGILTFLGLVLFGEVLRKTHDEFIFFGGRSALPQS